MNGVAQYTNRELDHYFQEIRDTLNRIEGQTTRTNGRVTGLEGRVLVLETNRRDTVKTISIIVTIFTAIVIPLLVYINSLQIKQTSAQISSEVRK